MQELRQRVLDNLMTDVLFGVVLLLVTAYGLHSLARFWKVSLLPLSVLLPSFMVAGLILYVPLSPLYVTSDGQYYQDWGFSLAAAWLAGEPMVSPHALWPGKGLWPLIIGGFTALAGPVTITLIVFNVFILLLSVIVLQKATSVSGGRSPRWSMVIVFLSSIPFLLWGPSLLREALFWLGVALGALALSYASVNRYRLAWPAVGLSALVLLGIRPDAGIVFTYGFVVVLILLFGIVGRKRSVFRAVGTSVVVLSLALSFPTAFDLVRGGEATTSKTILLAGEALSAGDVTTGFGSSKSSTTTTTASTSSTTTASSSLEFEFCGPEFIQRFLGAAVLCRAVANLPYVLFGPFHWEYRLGAIWLMAGISTLHFLVLSGFAAYYAAVSRGRRWPLVAQLAVALASILMFASILTNYGIVMRFRAATEILLVPLALSGALELSTRWKSSRKKILIAKHPKNAQWNWLRKRNVT